MNWEYGESSWRREKKNSLLTWWQVSTQLARFEMPASGRIKRVWAEDMLSLKLQVAILLTLTLPLVQSLVFLYEGLTVKRLLSEPVPYPARTTAAAQQESIYVWTHRCLHRSLPCFPGQELCCQQTKLWSAPSTSSFPVSVLWLL